MPNKYTPAHHPTALAGPDDARPSASQIIHDGGLVDAWKGRHVVVTGTSSGIGIPTAKAFAETGATVYATARSLNKARQALGLTGDEGTVEGGGSGKIVLVEMDNGSLESVRKGASRILAASEGKINVLIGNAGVMTTPEGKTVDGFETQFGTNHLAHFLLFMLLKDALLKAAKEDGDARVVLVSSMGHKYGRVRFEDYGFEKEKYDPGQAYGQSKTGNVWTANHISRLYGAQGLNGFSLNPGGIWTGLQEHMDPDAMASYKANPEVQRYMKSPAQGAATTVWGATAKELKGEGGLYLEDCDVATSEKEGVAAMMGGLLGYNEWAYNEEGEKTLWNDSLGMVGLP